MKIDTENCWLLTYKEIDNPDEIIQINTLEIKDLNDTFYHVYPNLDYALAYPRFPLFNDIGEELIFYKVSIKDATWVFTNDACSILTTKYNILEKYKFDDITNLLEIVKVDKVNDKIIKVYNGAFGYRYDVEYNENKIPVRIREWSRMWDQEFIREIKYEKRN